MDFRRLELFCRDVQDDIYNINAEIDASNATSCQEDLLSMLQTTVGHYVVEKRQLRDQMKSQCEALHEEIRRKKQLIGDTEVFIPVVTGTQARESATTPELTNIGPPYKPLLNRYMIEIEQLNSKVSERSQKRNRIWSNICTMSEQMDIPLSPMPDTLSDADIAKYESQEAALSKEKASRLQSVERINTEIKEMMFYLGRSGEGSFEQYEGPPLCVKALNKLKEQHQQISSVYADSKKNVDRLESQIKMLAATLETPLQLPAKKSGEGSQERIVELEKYLTSLNQLKLEKLDIFVNNALSKINQLWGELFLDEAQRKSFDTRTVNESLLNEIDAEIVRLTGILKSPERQHAISLLMKFKQIKANEEKLNEMSQDPGRLARRGFAASLKQEEKLRRFNEKHKPEVLTALSLLNTEWTATHNGETFFIDGKDLATIISEEKSKETLTSKRRASLGRKRPASSDSTHSKDRKLNHPPPKLRSAVSIPAFTRAARHDKAYTNNSLQGRAIQASRSSVSGAINGQPTRPASSTNKATQRVHPTAVSLLQNKQRISTLQQSRNNALRSNKPLSLINPSRFNLPACTPGRPSQIKKDDASLSSKMKPKGSALSKTALAEVNPPSMPSKWETEQLQRMQNMEMSYFDETSINESPSAHHSSFNYERDAF